MGSDERSTRLNSAEEVEVDQDRAVEKDLRLHDAEKQISLAPDATEKEEQPVHPEPVFSIFTQREKAALVFLAGLAALFSPISGSIYYAATPILARDLHVSISLINLTVTSYLIFQGLAPTAVGSLSDSIGRRPLYLCCFIIYIGANIGLALQNSYAALFVLRCIQSSGSSGTVALANAVVADIATSAKRGSYIALVGLGINIGPAFGPVIGGLLSHYINWQSIFWFLTIFSGVTFIILLVFLPETCRSVVGNGSIPVPKWNMSLYSYYKLRQRQKKTRATESSESQQSPRKPRPSLTQSFYILFDKESGIVLFYSGIFLAGFYAVLAGLPAQLEHKYGYNSLQIGLCFIPGGLGALVASLGVGKFLDWNFRRRAGLAGLEISVDRQQDLSTFPVEAARLEVVFPTAFLASGTIVVYGWLMEYRVFIAAPLIFLFLSTASMYCSFQGLSTLVVDLNRDRPSSASAAMNLSRCWLGAGATAAVVPLYNAVGIGWTSVLVAGIWIAMSPVVLLVIKKGPKWREEKKRKEEAKKDSMATP